MPNADDQDKQMSVWRGEQGCWRCWWCWWQPKGEGEEEEEVKKMMTNKGGGGGGGGEGDPGRRNAFEPLRLLLLLLDYLLLLLLIIIIMKSTIVFSLSSSYSFLTSPSLLSCWDFPYTYTWFLSSSENEPRPDFGIFSTCLDWGAWPRKICNWNL